MCTRRSLLSLSVPGNEANTYVQRSCCENWFLGWGCYQLQHRFLVLIATKISGVELLKPIPDERTEQPVNVHLEPLKCLKEVGYPTRPQKNTTYQHTIINPSKVSPPTQAHPMMLCIYTSTWFVWSCVANCCYGCLGNCVYLASLQEYTVLQGMLYWYKVIVLDYTGKTP